MNEVLDPYRAPESKISAWMAPREMVLAGRWRRFLTYVVDALATLLIVVIGSILLVLVLGEQAVLEMGKLKEFAFNLSIGLAYYLSFEGLWGRTPGKWICGTAVVTEDGLPPSFRQVLGRTFARYVPFEPFSIFGDAPTPWHDTWSRTRVVRTRLD